MRIFRRREHTPDGFAAGNQNPRKRGLWSAILDGNDSSGSENERNKGDDWTRRKPSRRKLGS